ncbi:hypothetical protein [Enterobacter dykesii]
MHTRNVNIKTAAQESSRKIYGKIARIIGRGYYNMFCLKQVHEHYGDKFTRTDACLYFIRGALSEITKKS